MKGFDKRMLFTSKDDSISVPFLSESCHKTDKKERYNAQGAMHNILSDLTR